MFDALLIPAQHSRAAFAGNNGLIAFRSRQTGDDEVFVMHTDGSDPTNITSNVNADGDPSFSPDAQHVVFASGRAVQPHILITETDGEATHFVTSNNDGGTDPQFAPNGNDIVFVRGGDVIVRDLVDGSETNLTTDLAEGCSTPTYAPSGLTIAADCGGQIVTMHADGTSKEVLTSLRGFQPDFSPDGSTIVFVSDRDDGDNELYEMNADGSDEVRLTTSINDDVNPAYSPDGTSIAFASDRDGDRDIYVMGRDGGDTTNLSLNDVYDDQPSWGPADSVPPSVSIDKPVDGSHTSDRTPRIRGTAGSAGADSRTVEVRVFKKTSSGALITKVSGNETDGAWEADVDVALTDGSYAVVATQRDESGNVGESEATMFRVAAPQVYCRGQLATHVGSDAGDHISGGPYDDVIAGLGGDDVIEGGRGDDVICGGDGADAIYGNDGNDSLYGERGHDRLFGRNDNDLHDGGKGRDRCQDWEETNEFRRCERVLTSP